MCFTYFYFMEVQGISIDQSIDLLHIEFENEALPRTV